MTDESAARERGLEIDWLRAVAGALAAVASAFLLSFLGAAGTIIGAAIGSLIVTISSAVFAEGLATSRRTLAKAQESAARKVGVAQAEVRRAERATDTSAHDSHLEYADERLAAAQGELDAVRAGAQVSWRERLRALPWRQVLLAAGALFLVAVVLITALELAAGRSVSSITGGSGGGRTTIGDVGDRGGGSGDQPQDETESPSPSPTDEQTGSPSPSDTTSPAEQTTEPTTDPSTEPTTAPTPEAPAPAAPTELGETSSPTP